MDETVLHTFPRSEVEALAMLYVKSQDLSGVTPAEMLEMYQSARNEIYEKLEEQYNARFEQL